MTPDKLVHHIRLCEGVVELHRGITLKLGTYEPRKTPYCSGNLVVTTALTAKLDKAFCDDPRDTCIAHLFDAQGIRVRSEAEAEQFVREWFAKRLYDNQTFLDRTKPGPHFSAPDDSDLFW